MVLNRICRNHASQTNVFVFLTNLGYVGHISYMYLRYCVQPTHCCILIPQVQLRGRGGASIFLKTVEGEIEITNRRSCCYLGFKLG
eukprot:UN02731